MRCILRGQMEKDVDASKKVALGGPVSPVRSSATHDPYLALRFRNGRLFIGGILISIIGQKNDRGCHWLGVI